MMTAYLEPLRFLIYNERAIKGEKSEGFGGYCSCGGVMSQKSWHVNGNIRILVSECESCWNAMLTAFKNKDFIERREVRVFKRNELTDFLSEILSQAELEAIVKRRNGENYNYNAFNRAKKKLEKIGIDIDTILSELIF